MVVGELGTAVQNGLPLIVVVFNNGVLQNVLVQQSAPTGRSSPIPTSSRWPAPTAPRAWWSTPAPTSRPDLEAALRGLARGPLVIDLRVDPTLSVPAEQVGALRARHTSPARPGTIGARGRSGDEFGGEL